MDVEKETYSPLVLVEGQVLLVSDHILKYIDQFKRAYEMGFRSFQEDKNFQLRYNLWRLVLNFLVEYEKTGFFNNNSWLRSFEQITQLERYEMIRQLDYYGIPVVMDLVLSLATELLLVMPRLELHSSHPLVQWGQLTLTIDSPFAKINKVYAIRRQEIMAICRTYIKTMDILIIIERDFLPSISTNILVSHLSQNTMLMSTMWGLVALGYNKYGQLGTTGIQNSNSTAAALSNGFTLDEIMRWHAASLYQNDWIATRLGCEASIISVSAGERHTIINTTHGLFACGNNVEGQLGLSTDTDDIVNHFTPFPLYLQHVLLVGCGIFHTLFYTRKGLYAAGDNRYGQLGIREHDSETDGFVPVPFHEPLSTIVCNGTISFLLSKDGRVYVAGAFSTGKVNRLDTFTLIATETPIIAITTTSYFALFLDGQGVVYLYKPIPLTIGEEADVDVDEDARQETFHTLSKISNLPPIASVVALHDTISFFIDHEGNVYHRNDDDVPRQIPMLHKVITVTCPSTNLFYFLTCDGLVKLYVGGEQKILSRVPLLLTDVPLCIATPSTTLQEKYHFACHQCGEHNFSALSYHKESQRVFCHTKTCLSDYKKL